MTAHQNMNSDKKISECEKLFRQSFVFVLDIIRFCELLKEKNRNSFADKLLIEATEFGENVLILKNNISNKAFKEHQQKSVMSAHKIKYLLQLSKYSENYPKPNELLVDIEKLILCLN